MKILVSGASGFLGKFLCKKLQDQHHEVFALSSKNCDLTKEDSLVPYQQEKFDQIYHLAAWTQAGDFCLHHPGEQWIVNQKINTNMLSFWSRYQPQAKMIAMGTSCSYDPTFPLEEPYYLQGLPIDSLFSYAMTKRMLLCGLISLNKQYGLKYLYLIPSTLYGPDYHLDGRQMHFIFDLIRKILQGKLYNQKVILWGDGYQKRELVHVEDFVSALLSLVQTQENTWINIGAGKEYSIREFAQIICFHANYPFEKISFDTTKYVGAASKVLSIQKIKNIIDWNPKPVEDGLKETICWFLNNQFSFLKEKLTCH